MHRFVLALCLFVFVFTFCRCADRVRAFCFVLLVRTLLLFRSSSSLFFALSLCSPISHHRAFFPRQLLVGTPVGTYTATVSINSKPSEQEPFSPGQYAVLVALCEGTCGSTHSNSYTIATASTNFTITA